MNREIDKKIFDDARNELYHADAKFPDFHSSHEGWGVLSEEMAELFDEIRADDYQRQREEAIQVIAMGIKFVRFLDIKMLTNP